ncbi:putative short-chain dehydrogenase [Astrocystis sublimbata]|nr:putative short-chain dehydrogenase [Astrocystis sublimbata]KAI0191074.1 putative short-chain dehydrogenase [Astrocystis sublimbata]KAI0191081.1 putative short-chain dehydrogenase [Astrocystis sublimbata]
MVRAAPDFGLTPEKEATFPQYLYRQFIAKTPALTRRDAVLHGMTAIVTGSNTGLGLEVSRQLLDLGLSRPILAVRSTSKGKAARKELLSGYTNTCEIEIWTLDLSDYDSVVGFGQQAHTLPRLDIAVLNAGVFKVTEEFNPKTGIEQAIQINYLSNALLMLVLLPVLRAKKQPSAPTRLVLVSSDVAGWAKFPEQGATPLLPVFKKSMDKWDMHERYATSKLPGQLFLTELAERVPPSEVIIDATNPGLCYGSEFQREGNGKLLGYIFKTFTRLVGNSCSLGARTITHAAVKFGEEAHGQYIECGKLRPKAAIIYKPEGERLSKQLWDETMASFSSLGVAQSF